MSAERPKVNIVLVFALTLGAGIVAGMLVARLPFAHKTGGLQASRTSWLVHELDLTPAQSEQMRKIWEGVKETTDQSTNDAVRAREKRDADIQKLVPADKLEEYRATFQAYDSTVAKLKADREAAFDQAVKRTREMLTPAQQEKYNIILKNRLEPADAGHQDSANKTVGGPGAQPSPS